MSLRLIPFCAREGDCVHKQGGTQIEMYVQSIVYPREVGLNALRCSVRLAAIACGAECYCGMIDALGELLGIASGVTTIFQKSPHPCAYYASRAGKVTCEQVQDVRCPEVCYVFRWRQQVFVLPARFVFTHAPL